MKKPYVFIFLFIILFTSCKNSFQNTFYSENKNHQDQLNQVFRNPKETPLRGKYLEEFKGLPFFSINPEYKVVAKLEKIENSEAFDFPTSSGKTKRYRKYGYIHFILQNKPISLSVYQSISLLQKNEFKDYLFLPFRDQTNGKLTYGGGRYMDLRITKGESIVVDFNKAYHPYCAYNAFDYNCPIVPEENAIPLEIRSGVMYEDIYFQ